MSRHASPRGGSLLHACNAHGSLKSPVRVRLDHVATIVVNANPYPIASLWRGVPQPTEWQRIGNEINAAVHVAVMMTEHQV
jgi:hypothetical protein